MGRGVTPLLCHGSHLCPQHSALKKWRRDNARLGMPHLSARYDAGETIPCGPMKPVGPTRWLSQRRLAPLALLLLLGAGCGSDKHRVLEVYVSPHSKASARLSSGIASFFSGSGAVELEGGDKGSYARYESWPAVCSKCGGPVEPAKP